MICTCQFAYKALAHRQLLFYLVLSLQLPAFGQSYVITDLNEPSDSYRLAHGINATGQVVGEYEPANIIAISAFRYDDGSNTDLGVLPGYIDAYAYGINDSSQIAGYCDAYTGNERAFLYANGVMNNLGTLGSLPTGGWSEAYSINRAGQVVGTATLMQTSINHAALWSAGTKKDLGSLGGPTYNSSAFGLNNSGVIVGDSEVTTSVNVHAFSYSNNIMTDLGALPGGSYSHASAVNDSGLIVGESDTSVGAGTAIHAFVCPHGPGSMQDLGTLGGGQSSAYGINNAGQIVGYAVNSNSVSRAFLFDGSKMVDLNDLIPPGSDWTNLEAAVGINEAGQIAGYGQFAGGVYHAFLLTPVGPLTVTITNPAPNATFTAPATFVVGASVSDTAGTVTNVQFLVNGSPIGNSTSVPYSATASNLASGSYTLTAVASDNRGLKATNSISVAVTDTPPTVAITNPVPNATFQASATFSVGASAQDPDGTVTNVEFLVNGSVIGNATSVPYAATATSLSAGSYTLAAVASDNAGLRATNSITVTVLDAPPTVAITDPAPNATFQAPATVVVGAKASDTDGTVTNVQFLVNGTVIGNSTAAPYSATATNLSAGNYTLSAIASDNGGLNATNSLGIAVTSDFLASIVISKVAFSGTTLSFSFATQTGHIYEGQFTTSLSLSNFWITFTNLTGNGSAVTVTDSKATNGLRVYRVVAQ